MNYDSEVTFIKSPFMAELEVSYKSKTKASERVTANSGNKIAEYVRAVWDESKIEYVEEMVLILLNSATQIIGWVKICTGSTNQTVVDPKIIFGIALTSNAAAIVVAHNHPSGNLSPSQHDITISRRLKEGGDILGIKFLDSLIITAEGFYSLANEGLI